jgi:hypothetical protein
MNRNAEHMPGWAQLSEITMMRATIQDARPEVTAAELDVLTFPELSRMFWNLPQA